MKKSVTMVLAGVLLVSIIVVGGCSKGYETKKTADDLSVTLKADRYPLIKGDNSLSVSVVDTAGNAVTNASVQVRYYMPPMPGMAPMEFNTQAAPKGNRYFFTANIPTEGGWKIDATVTQPEKVAVTATFNVDVR